MDGKSGYSLIPGGRLGYSVGYYMERGGVLGPWIEGESISWALNRERRYVVDPGWRAGLFLGPGWREEICPGSWRRVGYSEG